MAHPAEWPTRRSPATDCARSADPQVESSTAGESSEEELLASLRLAEEVERDVRDERRRTQWVLELGSDGLSVEAGSDCPERLADADFRLPKNGWLLVSRFLEKQLGLRALGLVKSLTQC